MKNKDDSAKENGAAAYLERVPEYDEVRKQNAIYDYKMGWNDAVNYERKRSLELVMAAKEISAEIKKEYSGNEKELMSQESYAKLSRLNQALKAFEGVEGWN